MKSEKRENLNKFNPVKMSTLSESIAEQILDKIAQGVLQPGDRLQTEFELMKQFKVGRSTLREAIQSLVIMGVVETRRSAGTYITGNYIKFLNERLKLTLLISPTDIQQIMEVRRGLEIQTTTLAAERSTPEQKQELNRLIALMEKNLNDPIKTAMLDYEFHMTIAQGSSNPILINLVMSVKNVINEYIKLGNLDGALLELDFKEHKKVNDAIQLGSPQQAAQAMQEHLDSSAQQRLKTIQMRENVDKKE